MQNIYYRVADRSKEAMEAFENRYEVVSKDDIQNVFDFYGYKVENLERSSSWGTSHIVYYAKIKGSNKRLVFRSNAGKKGGFDVPELVMLSEKIVTDTVRALGVPTNHILHVDVSRAVFPFDYQIQEELIGTDPEKYIDAQGKFLGTRQDYDELSFDLGQAIARYSAVEYDGYGLFDENALQIETNKREGKQNNSIHGVHESFYEYIITNLSEHLSILFQAQLIDKTLGDSIVSKFKKYSELINDSPSALVHHDLADHNLMYNPSTKKLSGIFDWEAMVLGDPLLDLASCPTWTTHYPRRDKLLEGYSSIRELPSEYEIRMSLYELRTWIWKAKFGVDMGWSEFTNHCMSNIKVLTTSIS